jgi:cytochrome P450
MHKRQRRVIVPVFSQHTVAQFHPLFLDKTSELREILLAKMDQGGSEIDVVEWTRRLTYDIIGLAAFDYALDSLHGSENELYRALDAAFDVTDTDTPWVFLQIFFPILRQLVSRFSVLAPRRPLTPLVLNPSQRTPTGRVYLHLEKVMNKIAKVRETFRLSALRDVGS